MEPKCNYCDFFGEKYHCNNCKIFNGARNRTPQEITCSLTEFVEYIEKTNNIEDIEEKFGIGDYIYIEAYTGEKFKVIILDYGKDRIAGANGITAKVTLGIMDVDGYFQMNLENTNAGGYAASLGRARMDRFYRILPKELREHIQTVEKKSSAGSRSTEILSTEDKVWMFSEIEILGTNSYSVRGEGEQYEYFKKQENRYFNKYIWLRSPNYSYGSSFVFVSSNGGWNDYNASNSYGVAFGFCLGSII